MSSLKESRQHKHKASRYRLDFRPTVRADVFFPGSPNDQVINAVILATTGFFIGGPSNMISSAISADLGRQDALRGSHEALATVTGIVDGTGSIGAAAGQVSQQEDTLHR